MTCLDPAHEAFDSRRMYQNEISGNPSKNSLHVRVGLLK